jgi:tetratricopeptide (TPR) repeat protein
MPTHATSAVSSRQPWLAALEAAPEAEVRALVDGYADIPPYGRAEPADAAVSLLFGLDDDDPARTAFDQGCSALLETLRAAIIHADEARYERLIATLGRLLAVIRRTHPSATLYSLHDSYAYWFRIVETAVIDQGLDLRREFWRVLGLTQDVRTPTATPRRLMTLWFELCAEAGPLGRYDETYLDVGLIGLRRLPLGPDDDSNEEAVCHGIAQWAARQHPDKRTFLNRWREIEAAYPRTPSYWPPLVQDVIVATEEYLAAEPDRRMKSFPAAAWWREELELPPSRPGDRPPPSERQRAIEPPPREMREAILRAASSPIGPIRARVERLMRAHQRYADTTGDTYYLVRTACNVGMRLLRENPAERVARGEVAVTLARRALDYAPSNVFAWALWRDALAARGALDAAEQVGWEALRRYPENPQWRTQLATLLAGQTGRVGEAERLLRQTVALFPFAPAARPQLATLLADRLNRPDEAAALLREAIQTTPDNIHSYNQLATLLADRFGDRAGAIALLQGLEQRQAGNEVTRSLLSRLQAGQPARRQHPAVPSPIGSASGSIDTGLDLPTARVRRALFRAETADASEVRRLLDEDPGLAYARYAAQRVGAAEPGARIDTAFAFAFERAAREGSTQAFEALAAHAFGMEMYVARAGLTLLSGEASFDLPAGANDAEPGSAARRFAVLTEDIGAALRRPNADRTVLLGLLADYAATELSSGLAA